MFPSESEGCSVVSDSLRPHGLYSPWNSPGQNTGVGSLSFLQGIFPTQGLNPGLPYCRCILYQISQKGNSRILEWVTYPFSRESSWPRNQTGVSCIAGRFSKTWEFSKTEVSIFLLTVRYGVHILVAFLQWHVALLPLSPLSTCRKCYMTTLTNFLLLP